MADLHQELDKMGLSALSFNQQEQVLLEEFIAVSAPFYNNVCQHKADRPACDLVLGLLTKSQQEAIAEYRATLPKISELKRMFSDQVGTEHADKFITLNQEEVAVISSLWFMAQGYTGIDFSYASDHAQEIAELLGRQESSDTATDNCQHYRSRFMQAYYTGIDYHQKNQPDKNAYVSLKRLLKRLFGL